MRKKQEITLLKWLRRYWITMFLCLLAAYFPLQSVLMTFLEQRMEESVHNGIQIAENGIETSLEIVDSFIYESLYNSSKSTSTQLYNALANEQDPVRLAQARTTLINYMCSIVSWSDMIDFMLLYTDRDDGEYWMEAGLEYNFRVRKEIKQFITECVRSGRLDQLSRYMICRTESGSSMLRLLRIESSYLVLSVSGNELIQLLMQTDTSGSGIAFAADSSGAVIFSSAEIDSLLPPEQGGRYVRINGKDYLQTGSVSDRTGCYFGMLTEKSVIMEDLWVFQMLFSLVFLLLLIVIPVSFYIILVNVEKPIGGFVSTMNRIAEGDLELTVAEDHRLTELRQLAGAFNHMIRRIQKLKIEKYEATLETQKASMQYLQLQIKPHFYVNMLNIIYSLAERRDYATIQRISHAVVCYSRYMFRDASELVELRRELEHVDYYMEIHQIRYNTLIECTVDVPEMIRGAQVPPFVIQSFVENSVKYAFSANETCRIHIQARTDPEKTTLKLFVRDNGSGYSQDYLDRDWVQKGEAGHIGLTNVHQRLQLIFGDRTELRLYNDYGAVAEITMPYISVEDVELDELED